MGLRLAGIAIMVFASFIVTGLMSTSYSAGDMTEKLSASVSSTFSPGYVNAAKQKTDSIVNQSNHDRWDPFGFMVESAKNMLSNKTEGNLRNKVSAELQKKSTPTNQAVTGSGDAAQIDAIASSAPLNIKIGSGESAVYENGRLISEIIGGKRYVYAGFDNVGKRNINDAINAANEGDSVVVKGGSYFNTYYGTPSYLYISVKGGVNLYGGYSENGVRDIARTPTIINGDMTAMVAKSAEINGFVINSKSGPAFQSLYSGGIITLINNTFNTDRVGVYIRGSSVVAQNNIFNAGCGIRVEGGYSYRTKYGSRVTYGWKTANVILNNNDFFGAYGVYAIGSTVLTSTEDYYAGINKIEQAISGDFGGAIINYDKITRLNVANSATNPNTKINAANVSAAKLLTIKPDNDVKLTQSSFYDYNTGKEVKTNTLSSIFKSLIESKNNMVGGQSGIMDKTSIEKIVADALGAPRVSSVESIEALDPREMKIAAKLADILQNPTQDQKVQIDILESLMKDLEQIQKETGSAGLKKQESDLLQMVATVLLAQALPDLLKEGDVSNIKGIFANLGEVKGKILLDYQESTRPYYEEIRKVLSRNINALQLNSILSKNIIQKDVENLSRNEIDKILDKLRKLESKSFEEDYMLQQEAKYREKYIDPNNRKLEAQMKTILQDFTRRMYSVLNGANMVKEDASKKK